MAAVPPPHGQILSPEPHATVADLLQGRQMGWSEHEGKRVASDLDPVRLVQHFRRIGACGHGLGRPPHKGGKRVNSDLLKVLHLALRERGWIISKNAVVDAWWLASMDPNGPNKPGAASD